jgi:hypothetical protein
MLDAEAPDTWRETQSGRELRAAARLVIARTIRLSSHNGYLKTLEAKGISNVLENPITI